MFDILATTLWVVTAPKQEGRPARGLGLKLIFLALDLYGGIESPILELNKITFTYGQIS